MKYQNLYKYAGLTLFTLALLSFSNNSANAALDCGNDPVYTRDLIGQTSVGSRVRSIACMEGSDILTVIPAGTNVHIIAETDGWYKVKVGSKTGWVGARLIRVTGQNNQTDERRLIQTRNIVKKEVQKPQGLPIVGINERNFARLQSGDHALINRLKNKIVLRVHFHGQAYLVNEDGTLKRLTGDEVRAYHKGKKDHKKIVDKIKKQTKLVVRKIVGISEANFAKLKAGNKSLLHHLSDKIILRVQSHGEAYWVNPNGELRYLTKSKIGEYLTKKITVPVKKVSNKVKEKVQEHRIPVSGEISLTGQLTDPGKIRLDWSLNGVEVPKGFKVVMSTEPNPVYPGNKYHYKSSPSTRHDYWTRLRDNTTYHFRVCQYLGGKCGVYSNDVAIKVKVNGAFAEGVMPGNINLGVEPLGDGKVSINWDLVNMDSPKGYKVVVSEEPDPVYPGNDYHYISNPEQTSDTWSDLTPGKTYHFRVCEYLGGFCGTYSPDVSVIVK